MTDPPEGPSEVFLGFGTGAILNVAAAAVLWLLFATGMYISSVPIMAFGGVQLLWMVPVLLAAIGRDRRGFAKGLALAVGVTFLINVSCWVVVMVGLGSSY